MKKVFMSAAIIAIMAVAVSCGSNNSKKAEKAAEEPAACEEQCDPVKEAAKEAGDAIKDAATEKVVEGINAAGEKAVEAIKK